MEKKITTHDRRLKDIEKLNGEYNGWWIYQYCMGIFNERQMLARKERR